MKIQILQMFIVSVIISTHVHSDTIKTPYGDKVDCVDIRKQPAFQNELLKNHKLQENPSEIPEPIIRTKSKLQTQQAHVTTVNCPKGTVPVRQDEVVLVHGIDQPQTNYNAGHEYAITATSKPPSKIYGTKTTINVWDPKIEKGANELSISQFWVASGHYETGDLNSIEAGWLVYPDFYKDNRPRFFIYWTSDAYINTGGYNLQSPGFIQTSSSVLLGGPITPVSKFEGSQYELTVLVWKDKKYGNWWLSVGSNHTIVGYWPSEIFTKMDHTVWINWGGEITNTNMSGQHTKTQMGSGHFPNEGFGKASYFRNLEIVNGSNSLEDIQDFEISSLHPDSYDIKNLYSEDWGHYFFYGGPGRSLHSGAVCLFSRFSFSLIFFCCSFIFMF